MSDAYYGESDAMRLARQMWPPGDGMCNFDKMFPILRIEETKKPTTLRAELGNPDTQAIEKTMREFIEQLTGKYQDALDRDQRITYILNGKPVPEIAPFGDYRYT